MLREGQIGHPDRGRVAPPARTPGRNDGDLVRLAVCNHRRLETDAVDRVDDRVIAAAQIRLECPIGDEIADRLAPAERMDVADAFGHHLDLRPIELAGHGMALAVHIARLDGIVVDQGHGADPGSRERLRRPRSHPADADDTNMQLGNPRALRRPVEPSDPAETRLAPRRKFGSRPPESV